jgi:deoxyribodipyrimidine photo-lyase
MHLLQQLREDPRVTVRKDGSPDPEGTCVVYWMERGQRGIDNPALDVAVRAANELAKPVVVFFAPILSCPHGNLRHHNFLASGIPDIAEALARRRIGFILRPSHHLLKFCAEVRACLVIGDENPMREPEAWRIRMTRQIRVPFWTVDADVIVPSRLLGREHFAARTIRPRLQELLPDFLQASGNPKARRPWTPPSELRSLAADETFIRKRTLGRSIAPVCHWRAGNKQATRRLQTFVEEKLAAYPEQRNHPEQDGTSQLSPYLHFGQLGPHTIALAIRRATAPAAARDAFLEQLIVRRELAVNFVRFNPAYDSVECLEPWAARSLAQHTADLRPITYTEAQLENAETHDPLWNAAQRQMVLTGWMHNYLRMYWAKKILEWSPSIAVAFQRAVRLNDRYELDGCDPNGYAGIAWAIVGKHDRAWSAEFVNDFETPAGVI